MRPLRRPPRPLVPSSAAGPAFPSAAELAAPPPARRGDLLLALGIALTIAAVSLPAALREPTVHVPRFEPLVLDPNRAPAEDLRALPGIGQVLAGRIVADADREPYREPGDLLRVHGVGPKLLAGARPHLRFPAAETAPPETPR